jgi:Caspase domain
MIRRFHEIADRLEHATLEADLEEAKPETLRKSDHKDTRQRLRAYAAWGVWMLLVLALAALVALWVNMDQSPIMSRRDSTDPAVAPTSDDPLRHGHALLIGNSRYREPSWTPLDDVPLQLAQLENGLKEHFDTVKVVQDLEALPLLNTINDFFRQYWNDNSARLLIYYAGHGYTEIQRNESRGYITGIDTPRIDGTQQAYDAARPRAISMLEILALLERAPARSILFLFDSCCTGTIFTNRFTNRAGNDPPRPLTPVTVRQLMDRPARDIITAGRSDQRVPAHSPIPALFLAALNGAADRYKRGVISSSEIHAYLVDRVLQMRDINLTPQVGRLPNPEFAEGTFLFRVPNPKVDTPL